MNRWSLPVIVLPSLLLVSASLGAEEPGPAGGPAPATRPDGRQADIKLAIHKDVGGKVTLLVNDKEVPGEELAAHLRELKAKAKLGPKAVLALVPDESVVWREVASVWMACAGAEIANYSWPDAPELVKLPDLTGPKLVARPSIRVSVSVGLDRAGKVVLNVNGQSQSPDSLKAALTDLHNSTADLAPKDQGVIIRAGGNVPWRAVLGVYRVAAGLGFQCEFSAVAPGEADVLNLPPVIRGDGGPVVTRFEGIEPYGPGKQVSASQPGETGGRSPALGGESRKPITFFGVRAAAASQAAEQNVLKVVYVVDSSGSMFETFDYVKAELVRSINSLAARQSFSVLFFGDGPPIELTIDGKAQLDHATAENKKAAKEWIDKQIARSMTGQTDAQPSMERAFKIDGGPPDVIYLLTDGLLPDGTAKKIKELNTGGKVRVNTIGFRDRLGEKQLQEIAKQNGGVYKFISIDILGQDY